MTRIVVLVVLGACTQPRAPIANTAGTTGSAIPLPEEPWFRDKADKYDDCVEPLAAVPAQHLPAPFEACDPRVESFASPPGGNEMHFHYRYFSAALTTSRRTTAPATCCYMIWEFPRRD